MTRPSQLLLSRHTEVWCRATRHPFLDAIRDGTLAFGAFATWLAQDYLFVADLLAFQARLLGRAPRAAHAVLVDGLVALVDELGWFEQQAEPHGIVLDVPRQPTTRAYRDLFLGLEHASYPAAITALWALERVYLESWMRAAPGHSEYRAFVEHWTAPGFARYVDGLAQAADLALTSGEGLEEAEAAFLEAVHLERDFWEMAWSGGGLV